MKRFLVMLILGFSIVSSATFSAFAAGETFQVISVATTGCAPYNITFAVERANLDGGIYVAHTVVTVGGFIYMNEDVSISLNGSSGWSLYNNFNYGAVPNQGTWPLPAGEEVKIEFFIERPLGTVLYSWVTVLDSCDTGNILYNGVPTVPALIDPIDGTCSLPIPEGSVVGEAPNGAQIYYEPGNATNLYLNPGTYTVIGQDESETYYQVVLACDTVWVLKDTMQPSFQSPQNGAPLPTRIL